MTDLTRFSVSLEPVLLAAFDRLCEERGYATRSEAIRDLLRDRLLSQQDDESDAQRVAVVSLVYDHHARRLADRLVDRQHERHDLVVATLHVHLGSDHCLEVIVLRGSARDIRRLGNELVATKGVLHGDIRLTADEGELRALHAARHQGAVDPA